MENITDTPQNSKNFIVVCETIGCENEGIPIVVPSYDESPIVFCGPCGKLITLVAAEI